MASHPEAPAPAVATFGLKEVLSALSRDLVAAREASKTQSFGLFVQEVEVELAFTVEHSSDEKAGVNIKVFGVGFDAGGTLGKSAETVHRIQLKLSPEGTTGSGGMDFGTKARELTSSDPNGPVATFP
jgi:hypothetical protein